MNPFKKYLILLLIGGFGVLPKLQAQSDLQISKVFDKYGEGKGGDGGTHQRNVGWLRL